MAARMKPTKSPGRARNWTRWWMKPCAKIAPAADLSAASFFSRAGIRTLSNLIQVRKEGHSHNDSTGLPQICERTAEGHVGPGSVSHTMRPGSETSSYD